MESEDVCVKDMIAGTEVPVLVETLSCASTLLPALLSSFSLVTERQNLGQNVRDKQDFNT